MRLIGDGCRLDDVSWRLCLLWGELRLWGKFDWSLLLWKNDWNDNFCREGNGGVEVLEFDGGAAGNHGMRL